jgi:hypothetical protein
MNPRIEAAISAAGWEFAKVVQLGDRLGKTEISQRIVEEANYSLRPRGLRIEDAGFAGWIVVEGGRQ